MKKILTGIFLAVGMLPVVAFAQFGDFEEAIGTVTGWINLIIPFLLLLATLYFFWGLTKFILKAGNEEEQGQAKQMMIWGVVAVFVMVSFWGLVGFLSATFGGGGAITVTPPPDITDAIPG